MKNRNLSSSALHRRRLIRWSTFVFVGSVAPWMLGPGCKPFETCADSDSCGDDVAEQSSGGQGGASQEPRDEMGGAGETGGGRAWLLREVECDGECIDPRTDSEFCGATGSCTRSDRGISCGDDEHCVDRACQLDCGDDVLCDGSCIDPTTDNEFCGADSDCSGATACDEDQQCVAGSCAGWGEASTVSFVGGAQLYWEVAQMDGPGDVVSALTREDAAGQINIETTRLLSEESVWTLPERLEDNAEPAIAGSLRFSMNEAGQGVAVWRQAEEGGTSDQVWAAVRAEDGTWGMAQLLSMALAGEAELGPAYDPEVVVAEDGSAYVAWAQSGDAQTMIRISRWSVDERSWSAPSEVPVDSATTTGFRAPTMAPLPGGEILLAFTENLIGSSELFVTVTTDGQFEEATMIDRGSFAAPMKTTAVASNSRGLAAVVGVIPGTVGMSQQQVWTAVYQDGQWSEPEAMIVEGPDVVTNPVVVVGDDDRMTVAWRSLYLSGTARARIEWVERSALEESWSDVAYIQEILGTNVSGAFLATDGFDNLQIAWSESDTIYGARKRPGQSEWSEPVALENLDGSVSISSLDFNDAGQGVITWKQGGNVADTLGFNLFR